MELKSKVGPITAVVLAVILVVWMIVGGNGLTTSPSENQATTTETEAKSQQSEKTTPFSVQAKHLVAESTQINLPLSGITKVNEELLITNSNSGKIDKLFVKKGDFIKRGATILEIDTRSLRSQLTEARLLVKQRQLELDGIKKLSSDNLSTKVSLAQAETALASAKATEKNIQINIENSIITAPFSGVLNTLDAKKGQFINNGAVIGNLVSLNPIRVMVNIPQNKIQEVKKGTFGNVILESGFKSDGVVSYISSEANAASRTISVEMLVDNPNNEIPAGLTAAVEFVLDTHKAHAFSPALLTLNDSGRTAVKTLSVDNEVVISDVDVIKSERNQIWVSGLPDSVNLITVGQGFVSAGDKVDPHYQN